MKWISVEDELPEFGKEVIVYTKAPQIVTCLSRRISNSSYFDWVWDNKYGGCNVFLDNSVTHWMPLPEPPK